MLILDLSSHRAILIHELHLLMLKLRFLDDDSRDDKVGTWSSHKSVLMTATALAGSDGG
jgi:hypothetical protein